jgi:ABC-2 type transport system ATP-binding protein
VVADDLVVIGNGRIVAQGTKAELLASTGTHVRTRHPERLAHALQGAGVVVHQRDQALTADADPERVGYVAHEAGVPLIELRTADGAGLEELFLELTADTQRDVLDHDPIHAHQQGAAA